MHPDLGDFFVNRLFCKYRFYNFIYFFFFIYLIDFNCFTIISSAADNGIEKDKIQVAADSLNINNKENYAEFIGAVRAVHKGMTINSDRLKIYYKNRSGNIKVPAQNQGSVKKIIAEGNVIIISEDRIANSDKAEYMAKTGVVILTGKNVKITSAKNYITGNKIVFNRFSGKVKVIGNSTKRVKAVFFADKKSSEFNILKTGKDDSDKIIMKKEPAVELKNRMESTQVAPEVIQDNVVEKSELYERDIHNVNTDLKESEHEAMPELLSEEPDGVIAENLPDNDNSIQLDVLTPPEKENQMKPQIEMTEKMTEASILVAKEVATGELKNKIGIIFLDQKESFGGNNYNIVLNDYLLKFSTKECRNIYFLKLNQDDYPSVKNISSLIAPGRFNNAAILKTSRDTGLNAIIIATIEDIYTEKETRGMLWFRNDYNVLMLRVVIAVYDTETGSKIFNESFLRKKDIDEAASEKTVDQTVLVNLLTEIAKEAADKFSDILTTQSWTGFFKSTEKDNIIISSGRNTGLKPGNILDVYDTKTIQGYNKSNFIMPDNKIGMIQITNVDTETSQAVLMTDTKIKEDNLLKIRPRN